MNTLIRTILFFSYIFAFTCAAESFSSHQQSNDKTSISQVDSHDERSHEEHSDSDCGDCHVNVCCHHAALVTPSAFAWSDQQGSLHISASFLYKAPFTTGLKRPPIA